MDEQDAPSSPSYYILWVDPKSQRLKNRISSWHKGSLSDIHEYIVTRLSTNMLLLKANKATKKALTYLRGYEPYESVQFYTADRVPDDRDENPEHFRRLATKAKEKEAWGSDPP